MAPQLSMHKFVQIKLDKSSTAHLLWKLHPLTRINAWTKKRPVIHGYLRGGHRPLIVIKKRPIADLAENFRRPFRDPSIGDQHA